MTRNIKLILAYDGTRFFGWQKTSMGPSIEEELEKALSQILQHPIHLQAASRTDAGVHAEGQVSNFFTEKAFSLKRLQKSLNALLPKEISILQVDQMPLSFHPTLDNRGKAYNYSVCLGPAQLPFYRHTSWHLPYPIDIDTVQQAALYLKGRHDFAAFTNEKQTDNIREVFGIEILPLPANRLRICVSGNRFLYKMVRNIVGTVLDVGCGKISPHDIPDILQSKDRRRAGVTAPAHGLVLTQIFYD